MAKKTNSTSNLSADKAKAVEAAIAQIEKNYGKGSIMALGSQPVQDIPVIPTGCIQLDMALGVGGFPRGRIIEIYGPESSGKTTLTLHAIAEAQKLGGVAAFIDAEHAFDAVYARKLGVDIESLLVSQPDTGEQALDIAETLVRSGAIDIIVIDSVAALVPQAEINGEMGDNHVGLQARLMSQALRKLTGILSKSSSSGPSDTASHTTPKMSATAGSTLTYLPPSRKNPMEPSRRFWQPEQSRQNCIRARSCAACASPTRFLRRQTSPSRKLTPSRKSTSAIGKGKN